MMKCEQCGVCCKLFLINLTEEEYKSGKYRLVFDELGDDLDDGKCSIHADRPNSCRNFFCSSDNPQFKNMISKIKEYKNKEIK